MRYEYEVGDYVKIIANASNSKHPIGYVGKVLKSENFPKAEMPGLWYVIEEKEGGTYSHGSELVIATKAEYEAYYKPKLPEYVECLVGSGDFTRGKIYRFPNPTGDKGGVFQINILNGSIWQFKASTKEAFDAQNKPKPKFKVGDKVKLLVDKVSKSFYDMAKYYLKDLILSNGTTFIVDRVTNNGRPEWDNQFIVLKGYSYVHPIDCFELYTEPQFKVGDWVKIINSGGGTHPHDVGLISKIVSTTAQGIYPRYTIEIADMKEGNADKFLDPKVIVLATESEVKTYLLKEAERRGFKAGVTYLNHSGGRYTADINPAFWDQYSLYCGSGQGLVYNDQYNKWATIVPKTKVLCGHQVVKPESSSIISIGCKSISKGEIQGFLNVCDKFGVKDIWAEIGTTRYQTNLDAIKEALK